MSDAEATKEEATATVEEETKAEVPADAAAAAADEGEGEGEGDEDLDIEALEAQLQEAQEMQEKMQEMTEKLKQAQETQQSKTMTSPGPAAAEVTDEERMQSDQRSIYIGNVDYTTTDDDLMQLFAACGDIVRVLIKKNKFTGKPMGFAYMEFKDKDSVELAVTLDGEVNKGRPLKVTHKRTNISGFAKGARRSSLGRSGGRRGRGRRGGGRRGGYGRRGRGRGHFPY